MSEFPVDELAAALRLSRCAAGGRLHMAVELTRLAGTACAPASGELDIPKVRSIVEAVEAVAPLDDPTARAVEARVLARSGPRGDAHLDQPHRPLLHHGPPRPLTRSSADDLTRAP